MKICPVESMTDQKSLKLLIFLFCILLFDIITSAPEYFCMVSGLTRLFSAACTSVSAGSHVTNCESGKDVIPWFCSIASVSAGTRTHLTSFFFFYFLFPSLFKAAVENGGCRLLHPHEDVPHRWKVWVSNADHFMVIASLFLCLCLAESGNTDDVCIPSKPREDLRISLHKNSGEHFQWERLVFTDYYYYYYAKSLKLLNFSFLIWIQHHSQEIV